MHAGIISELVFLGSVDKALCFQALRFELFKCIFSKSALTSSEVLKVGTSLRSTATTALSSPKTLRHAGVSDRAEHRSYMFQGFFNYIFDVECFGDLCR
jgi:hypothetical protein